MNRKNMQAVIKITAEFAGGNALRQVPIGSGDQANVHFDGANPTQPLKFLILPHPEVAEYFRRKAQDYDRWLRGMRRLQRQVRGGGSGQA